MPEHRPQSHRLGDATTLSRNNLEFAGVVVYFFSLAVLFAMTIIVMLCQSEGFNDRAAPNRPPDVTASEADRS